MKSPRTPGQRAGLTRNAVLASAQALISAHGLEGLTMRRLAVKLGVAPNALYNHVQNKTQLIDDLLDEVLGDVEAPDTDSVKPKAGLEAIMRSTFQVLLGHAGLVPLYLARQGARGPNAQRLGEAMFRLMARAGITGEAATEARRVLIVYTMGFAALATAEPVEPGSERPLASEAIGENFVRGLRWLLAGILTGD